MRLGFVKWFLVGLAVVTLSGCGGSSTPKEVDVDKPIGGGDKPIVQDPDTTPPVITIIGEATVTISKGDNYTDAGATATDDVDGVVSVVTTGSVDTNRVGTYIVTYTATDSAENTSETDRTVTVEALVTVLEVKKTGQTKSYDVNGDEVTDGSLEDDGFYQKGVAFSYTRDDASNIVTDHITGLQWQDNNETVRKQWLTDANDDICDNNTSSPACLDTTGDTASTYCANLDLGTHTDWRLPTIDELMYIADRSKRDPAIDTSYFENVVSGYYWSSTTVVGNSDGAWNVNFYSGGDSWNGKGNSLYVRCVRDGQ